MKTYTAYIEWDPSTNLYAGTVPGIPGVQTRGSSLDELQLHLKEVLEVSLGEVPRMPAEEVPGGSRLREILATIHYALY